MSETRNRFHIIINLLGFYPKKFINTFNNLPQFISDYKKIKKQREETKSDFAFDKIYPCLNDKFSESGNIEEHYFHQDLLVARKIFLNNPAKHVDIGSRIDGFVAHVASFREIEVLDIRPLKNSLANIKFVQADLMSELDTNMLNYTDSLSCLHALEHFGLGRYGDPINYNGHLFGFNNLYKILKPGGKLYFSTPMGPQRIEFNAHRVFSVQYLLNLFKDKFKIESFSYIDDNDNLFENAVLTQEKILKNFDCRYGCAIFELTKI